VIPFLDVGAAYRELATPIELAVQEVLSSGWYIRGEAVERFERSFARYCEVDHAVGVANGLDALTLILKALGIRHGDEVIVSGHTFIASWLSISECGATPVPVDALSGTMNLDPEAVERAITPKTRAVVAVHLYGQPVEMDRLREVVNPLRIPIIEDAAQAHGARWRGHRVGSLGDAAAFSFYPGKNLGAIGDGGVVTTHDPDLATRIRTLANYGSRSKYVHEVRGVNSRLDEIQAAVLDVKLKSLDAWNARRERIADLYLDELREVEALDLPEVAEGTVPVWHLFVVKAKLRDVIVRELARQGVETGIHYPTPNHRSGAFSDAFKGTVLPVTEAICSSCFSLPIGPHLTRGDALKVARAVASAVRVAGD